MGKLFNIAIGAVTVGYLFFNRNPNRNIPIGENLISPADGRIQSIHDNKIEIFIDITDVHYQRAPYFGTITNIKDVDKTYNMIEMETPLGHIVVERYAGELARTVKTFVNVGDDLQKGQLIGKIILGSHCDIAIPPNMDIMVSERQHLVAGETIIAI